MSRYEPLAQFLRKRTSAVWEASFEDVEKILGFPLPPSAHKHKAWWANQNGDGHSQTAGWVGAGWRKRRVDLARQCVEFVREAAEQTSPTVDAKLFEQARAFSGISDRETLVAEGLKALIQREAARYLIELGGTMPDFVAPPRERPSL